MRIIPIALALMLRMFVMRMPLGRVLLMVGVRRGRGFRDVAGSLLHGVGWSAREDRTGKRGQDQTVE
ncbi:MAG: hypothetical protein WAK53_06735 [Chromatiaceae bacterium]